MKGAIGNAFILNMVITFIIIFFMLLIGSIAYSRAYKINKFLLDTLVDYVDDFNSMPNGKGGYLNQKDICFDCENTSVSWNDRVNGYLYKTGYILSNTSGTCPSVSGTDSEGKSALIHPNDVSDGKQSRSPYVLKRDTKVGDYDYCIYQKRYYERNLADDNFTKKRYSYKVISYMKFDFPIIGEFIKLPIVSESKVILNFH